jgi:hypothetical protein
VGGATIGIRRVNLPPIREECRIEIIPKLCKHSCQHSMSPLPALMAAFPHAPHALFQGAREDLGMGGRGGRPGMGMMMGMGMDRGMAMAMGSGQAFLLEWGCLERSGVYTSPPLFHPPLAGRAGHNGSPQLEFVLKRVCD